MTVVIPRFPPAVPKLLRLLDTDIDAECVAAPRALGRALRSNGQDFHSLAELVEHRRGDGRHHRRPGADRDPDFDDWRDVVRWCRARAALLNPAEAEFIAGMADWYSAPTPKQRAWLARIADRLRRAG
jgi:hypothetical protein